MILLVKTCSACPEQYDAYLDGKVVGYLRLRHGEFYVAVPNFDGEIIYTAAPKGDGIFEDDERDYYLRFAVDAIQRWLSDPAAFPPPAAPDVQYEIA